MLIIMQLPLVLQHLLLRLILKLYVTSIIININFNKGMCSNLVNNIRAERHCFKALYTETIKIMPHLET